MANPARKLMTVAEFAAYDDGTDRRHELIGGEVVMMSPPLPRHGILSARLARLIGNRLRRPCDVYSEAGIVLPWSAHDHFAADVAVSCTPPGRERWCPDPVMVGEVLSDSTERKDRCVKLPAYRRLPSMRDILLIASDETMVEHYARAAGGKWEVQDLRLGDTIRLDGLGIEFPLDELYASLSFDPVDAAAG